MHAQLSEPIAEYIGALCEVFSTENRLLFVGMIRAFDPRSQELRVELHKGSSTPRGIIHKTEVKLRVHASRGQASVVMLYGQVIRCADDYWSIEVQNAMFCSERRQSFRQQVSVKGMVSRRGYGKGRTDPVPCQLEDISLTGLKFRSGEHYEVGEQLSLSAIRLQKSGPVHDFLCTVQRAQPDPEGGPMSSYGCSFDKMPLWQEDELCADIFSLQARDLNRKR